MGGTGAGATGKSSGVMAGAAAGAVTGVTVGVGASGVVAETGSGSSFFLPKPGIRHAVLAGMFNSLDGGSTESSNVGTSTGGWGSGSSTGSSRTQSVKGSLASPAWVSTSHSNKFLPKAATLDL